MNRPIIVGGMGVSISTPSFARKCSMNASVLGTVSGVACERVMPRILQLGDRGGHFRRALTHFPIQDIAERIVERYYIDGGIQAGQKFAPVPAFTVDPRRELIELTVAANFAFVWLAKEGHSNPVSINYLEKIQMPHIYSITGAMLAEIDYVTMGAGVTTQIPGVLECIAKAIDPSYNVDIEGGKERTVKVSFDLKSFFGGKKFPMKKPGFLPIVSSNTLASFMARKNIQGFVVEMPTAGGHNAPPRDKGKFNDKGEPVYGDRDLVKFEQLQSLGIPFWLGGSFASPSGLKRAKELGAVGIQVGTIGALSEESGLVSCYKQVARRLGYRGELEIRTDPRASPTGFPFKVAKLPGTLSESETYNSRKRVCDQGALVTPFFGKDGKINYRCAAEPECDYVRKGGEFEDTEGARCICNGLMIAAGIGPPHEKAIITLGDDVSFLTSLMKDENDSYTIDDAIAYLLS